MKSQTPKSQTGISTPKTSKPKETTNIQVDETLRESEAHYRAIFENSLDAIFLTATDGSIFSANPAACQMFGRTEAEICQLGRSCVIDASDPRLPVALEKRLRTGRYKGELTFIRKDGSKFPGEISSMVFQDQDGKERTSMVIRDITERKRAEESLRERESILYNLFNNSEVGMFQTRLDGSEILNANEKFLEIFGWTREEMIGKPSVIYWADPRQREEMVSRLKAEGRVVDFECQMLNKNGEVRDCATSLNLYPEEGILDGSIMDITERKRTEEALRRSAEEWRATFDAAEDAICLLDEEQKILRCNQAMATLVQKGFDELIGQRCWEIVHGTPEPIPGCPLARMRETNQHESMELSWDDKWLDVTVDPIQDESGKLRGAVHVIRDITKRRRAEEALRENEERLRLANKATNDVIWDWDVIHDAQTWNEAGAIIFGWNEIVEQPQNAAWWIERVHAKDRDRVEKDFFNVVNDPQSEYWRDEYRFLKADGSYAQVVDRGYVLRDAQGKAVRMIGAMLDITERKETEVERERLLEQLKQGQENLHLLSKRLLEIQESERRAIALELHDRIGQDLTALKIQMQSTKRLKDISSIQKQLDQGLDYLAQISERLRALSLELRPSILDDLGIEAALRWFIDRQSNPEVSIDYKLEVYGFRFTPEVETICFRVAQEALTNSLQHAQATVISISLKSDEEFLWLFIEDNGVGFDTEMAFKKAAQGESLGLLGMQERVGLIGGKLSLDSSPGTGTRLIAGFPLGSTDRLKRGKQKKDLL